MGVTPERVDSVHWACSHAVVRVKGREGVVRTVTADNTGCRGEAVGGILIHIASLAMALVRWAPDATPS